MTDEAQKQAHKFATKLALAGQLRVKSVKEIYAAGYDAACTAEREKMLGLVKFAKDRMQFFDEPDETTMAHFDAHWKGLGNDR